MTARMRRVSGDAGTSLMELIIGMALMAIFMSMFTGAVVAMTSATNKMEAVTLSSGQTNQGFLRLDKLVRYASAISIPAKSTLVGGTGDWYVEVSVPDSSGVAICTQLRVEPIKQQLQQRTWTVTSDAPPVVSAASAWQPLADSITNTATDIPFALGTNSKSLFQQLQVTLKSARTQPSSATTASAATFTALNSTLHPPSSICPQWGRP